MVSFAFTAETGSGRSRVLDFLSVNNLGKNFGGIAALVQVEFGLEKGSIVGLIGPNGAGKSTLFNVITGFYKPDSGKVFFKGQDITGISPHKIARAGIARTFQLNRPFPNMTVSENLNTARVAKGTARTSRVSTEPLDLQSLGLADRQNTLAKFLSQGDLKRLEIGRALATKPELLLLDEPFGGSNPGELGAIVSLIEKLHRAGLTIFIIEHILTELMRLAERVIVMNNGTVIADGTPRTVVNDPEVITAYLGEGRFENA